MNSSSSRFATVLCLVAVGSIALPTVARARDDASALETATLRGRHGLMIHAGLLHRSSATSSISAGEVNSETHVNGFSGSFSYSYWAQEDWSVGLSAGAIDVQTDQAVTVGTASTRSAGVVPILFDVSWAPRSLAIGPSLRPSVSVAVGPYVGFTTNESVTNVVVQETIVESTIGVRARAGLSAIFGSWFMTGVEAGYHFVSAFDEPIGSEKDYSGPEFSIGFGVLLGRTH
jgi:hypothetical protein